MCLRATVCRWLSRLAEKLKVKRIKNNTLPNEVLSGEKCFNVGF